MTRPIVTNKMPTFSSVFFGLSWFISIRDLEEISSFSEITLIFQDHYVGETKRCRELIETVF